MKIHNPTRYSVGAGREGGCGCRCQEATVRGSPPLGEHKPGWRGLKSITGSRLGWPWVGQDPARLCTAVLREHLSLPGISRLLLCLPLPSPIIWAGDGNSVFIFALEEGVRAAVLVREHCLLLPALAVPAELLWQQPLLQEALYFS